MMLESSLTKTLWGFVLFVVGLGLVYFAVKFGSIELATLGSLCCAWGGVIGKEGEA